MKYKIFDSLGNEKSRNKIIACLERESMDIDEIGNIVKLDRTSVFYHLKEMQKDGWIMKKFVGKRAYFGLIQKYRKEEKMEEKEKVPNRTKKEIKKEQKKATEIMRKIKLSEK